MASHAYSDLTNLLINRIPEVQFMLEQEKEFWDPEDIPVHVVFGTVLARYIDEIDSDLSGDLQKHSEVLSRCFELIEEIANSSDFEARCVIEVSFLETLIDNADGWPRFGKYFLPTTKNMALEFRQQPNNIEH